MARSGVKFLPADFPDPPVIAAVRDHSGGGHNASTCSEMWQLCVSEKQVLERPDEDVLWVTDADSLFDELHHRTGGSDLYTFVEKDHYESSVCIRTTPKWLGPLDVKLFSKFLEKYPNACLRVSDPRDDNVTREKNWKRARHFIGKLKKLSLWDDYAERDYAGSIFLDYHPGAGKARRELQLARAAEARRWKGIQQRAEKSRNRYTLDISVKELGSLAKALHREIGRQLPKKVLQHHPNFRRPWLDAQPPWPRMGHASKAKIIERIIFCGGLLRAMDSPHHHDLSPTLCKALGKLIPRIKELKSKVLPFSDLGRYLSEEVGLLSQEGHLLET